MKRKRLIAKCGRDVNNRGKPFASLEALAQHEKDCPYCINPEVYFPLTELIADDDMSDGAYFALAWELGEL